MRLILLAIVSLCFSVQSMAGTISPSTSDSKHLEYGNKFKYVIRIKGKCCCDKKEEKHNFYASAVAISPRWILTAAHVVNNTSDVIIIVGEKEIKVPHIMVNKNFQEEKLGFGDIALGQCEEDIGLEFYPELYRERDEQNKIVSIAGYGLTGNFSTGAVISDNKKRAGSNIIRRIERNVLICDLSDRHTELEFIIASGDSGGGLFIGKRLAGINSFVMAEDKKPNSDYGDESAYTRISDFADWVDSSIKDAEK